MALQDIQNPVMLPDEIEAVLSQLDDLRFEPGVDEVRAYLVRRLVEAGVYPEVTKIGYSALMMCETYGARWHEYREPHHCQRCGADLCDREHGPPFKREIGIYQQDTVRTEEFRCPDCGGTLWALAPVPPTT